MKEKAEKSTYTASALIQKRRNDVQNRGAWLLISEMSSGKNSETCYFLKKRGEAVPPEPLAFDAPVKLRPKALFTTLNILERVALSKS